LSVRKAADKSECPNAADFFSGYNNIPALSVQAAVDQMLRFRYIAFAAPANQNHGSAFQKCLGLRKRLAELDPKYQTCANNANPLSSKTLITFKGDQAIAVYNSSYNFYLSQLRIRMELGFGRMTTKLRILRA
jgi:hypothetical protein